MIVGADEGRKGGKRIRTDTGMRMTEGEGERGSGRRGVMAAQGGVVFLGWGRVPAWFSSLL